MLSKTSFPKGWQCLRTVVQSGPLTHYKWSHRAPYKWPTNKRMVLFHLRKWSYFTLSLHHWWPGPRVKVTLDDKKNPCLLTNLPRCICVPAFYQHPAMILASWTAAVVCCFAWGKSCVSKGCIAAELVEKYGGLPIPWNPWDGRTVSFREGKSGATVIWSIAWYQVCLRLHDNWKFNSKNNRWTFTQPQKGSFCKSDQVCHGELRGELCAVQLRGVGVVKTKRISLI